MKTMYSAGVSQGTPAVSVVQGNNSVNTTPERDDPAREQEMRIGVISDTHGMVPAWQAAMTRFAGTDLILHAGDALYHPPRIAPSPGYDTMGLVELINNSPIPIVLARGNVDPEVYEELLTIPAQSPYALVEMDGLRIVVNHGHLLSPDAMRTLANANRADVLVTGHTHLPVVERIGAMIHVNPGSPSHPKFERDGTPIATVGLIADGRVSVVETETGAEFLSLPL